MKYIEAVENFRKAWVDFKSALARSLYDIWVKLMVLIYPLIHPKETVAYIKENHIAKKVIIFILAILWLILAFKLIVQ